MQCITIRFAFQDCSIYIYIYIRAAFQRCSMFEKRCSMLDVVFD